MKKLLIVFIGCTWIGFQSVGQPFRNGYETSSPYFFTIQSPNEELFSIGSLFHDVQTPVKNPFSFSNRGFYDDGKLMQEYQKQWVAYIRWSQPSHAPIYNPSRLDRLR